jgi:predicted ATPase/signal transduction histidine kinase/tRNA A-37 threonylcarbamoyl transferase component Bud32
MSILPKYQLVDQLYNSPQTIVYRAIHKIDNRPIIIKMLNKDYPTPEEVIRFKREYDITHKLSQTIEGIPKTLTLERHDNLWYMIFTDDGSQSLNYWLSQRAIDITTFLQLTLSLAEILGHIHHHNVIHKDINPSNILWDPSTHQVKIIDFGIASILSRENITITNINKLEGTLAYISPEQTGRMNRTLDYHTDFYSLGVTFYQLLTQRLPFTAEDAMELVHCHLAKQPPPPHEVLSSIPPVISSIILKLMAKVAEERYQSASGLHIDLQRCLTRFEKNGDIESFNLGQADISEKFQIPQKLYGRERETNIYLNAFEQICLEKVSFQLILVTGYSGIGKSALVHEIYKPITEKRGYFITGKFDQFQRNVPYSAIVTAFSELVRYLLTESESQLNDWKQRLLEALGVNGRVITEVIPEVERLIGPQPAVPLLGPTEAQNRFNLFFQNFVRVFCQPEHPLVIFLDDLQWVDSATLKLIELILTHEEMNYLFLIGAYRNNEVDPTHPLIQMLEKLKNKQLIINEFTLDPLNIECITQLVAETLQSDRQTIAPLANLVAQKTGGNPFFINQFLRTLYNEGFIQLQPLAFDAQLPSDKDSAIATQRWQWDIAHIKTMNITDNVVELMVNKLQKLPPTTQQVLSLAACVGNRFDLKTLSLINKKSVISTFQDLIPAFEEELVSVVSGQLTVLSEQLSIQQQLIIFKFLHDRVQQAAYLLIAVDQKQSVHLQIGRLLLKSISTAEIENKLFDIVEYFYISAALLDNQTEKNDLAQLSLRAGEKAKMAAAYGAAAKYTDFGLELLAPDSWQTQYDLTLALHESATEAAYLNGDFQRQNELTAIVLQQAQTSLDKVKVYEVKIQAYITQTQSSLALETVLQALSLLGINIPERPSTSDIEQILLETQSKWINKNILDLINLPYMSDPWALAVMRLLVNAITTTYGNRPDLFSLIVAKQVNLSIEYGNTGSSLCSYAAYGAELCSRIKLIEPGYQFGQVVLNLLDKFDDQQSKGSALDLIHGMVRGWKLHLKETLNPLEETYQLSRNNGNFIYAGYNILKCCYYAFLTGQPLTELEKKLTMYILILIQLKQPLVVNYFEQIRQAILNLIEGSSHPGDVTGRVYNESEKLPLYHQANDLYGLLYFYLNKLILNYLFMDFNQAVICADLTRDCLEGGRGLAHIAVFHFYDSLSQIKRYEKNNQLESEEIFRRVADNQEKMYIWAQHAPMNFQHKYDLVEAEKERVLGHYWQASELYEKAIKGAQENDYIQETALAYELAAEFYCQRGLDKFASIYLKEAHYHYRQWEAYAKVKDLETRYPQFFRQVQISQVPKTTSDLSVTLLKSTTDSGICAITSQLDLNSVIKASQTLSREMRLSRLLKTMIQIIIENAGAEQGYLLSEQDGSWIIKTSEVNNQAIQVATTIVNYVARTQEAIVLNNAVEEGQFTQDPYIISHQPKSILCVPLINQNKLVGIVYLENNLATGAFTPERVETVQLLGAQAAISLENARLYENLAEYNRTLETKVEERTQELSQTLEHLKATQQELVQSEKMAALGQLIAGVAHEINTPLGAIRASINNISDALSDSIQQLPQLLLELSTEQQELFFAFTQQASQPKPSLTSREERKFKRALIEELEEQNLENADDIADTLVDIGLYQDIEPFIPLLTSSNNELILQVAYDLSTQQTNSRNIETAVERASKIIFALKSYARYDHSGQAVQANLIESLNVVLTLYNNQLKQGIELSTHYQEIPEIWCYPDELNQVWTNIIHNAIQAMNNQGQLDIAVFPQAEQVVVQITDSGVGIPEEIQERIFEPFFTTKGAGEGSGLGLDIVKKIIDKHQGKITVESQPGCTTFSISLPIIMA